MITQQTHSHIWNVRLHFVAEIFDILIVKREEKGLLNFYFILILKIAGQGPTVF